MEKFFRTFTFKTVALSLLFLIFFASKAYAADPSTTGLLGYWAFDEGVGSTTADSSGNGHTGALNSIVKWIPGKIGSTAVSFSSTTAEYIHTGPDLITGSNATSTLTISGWFYPTGFGGNSAGRAYSNGKVILRTNTQNRLIFSNNNGQTNANTAINAVPSNTWTHVTVTRALDGTVNFYVNGILNGTPNQFAGGMATGTNFYIGNTTNGANQAWAGYIDDLRVYNRILSAAEITDLYTATSSFPDTIPPLITNGGPTGVFSVETNSLTLVASTSENAVCKYGVNPDTAYESMGSTFAVSGGQTHEETLNNLVGGTYTYYIRCEDSYGNENASDYIVSFTIVDTGSPVISNVVASAATTTATIQWITDETTSGILEYGLTTDYGASTTLSAFTFSHSISLAALRTGSTYHYRIHAFDQSANEATSSDQTFTTASTTGLLQADLFVDFENGTHGELVTPSILTGATYGSGGTWSTSTPQTQTTIAASSTQFALPIPVTVSGVGTFMDSGNRVLKYDNSVGSQFQTYRFTTGKESVSLGTFFSAGPNIPSTGNVFDHLRFEGVSGGGCVIQESENSAGNNEEVHAHSAGNGLPSTTGTKITIIPGKVYWATLKVDSTMCRLRIYDPLTWTQVGQESTTEYHSELIRQIDIGAGHSVVESVSNYWDNLIVDWTNAQWPLVPDAFAPSVTLTFPSHNTTVSGSVLITATATDAIGVQGVQFYIDGEALGPESTSTAITWDSTAVSNGTHTITAVARDGLYSATSTISVMVDNTPPDTQAPVISLGAPSGTLPATTTATILSVTTDEAATCKYSTATSTAYESMTSFDATGNTTHTTPITGLTSGTTYTYYIKCADIALNISSHYDISFSIASADTTPPIISSISATTSVNAATVLWTTNESADSLVQYGLTTSYGSTTTLDPTLLTSHSMNISGLSSNTTYHYRVISKDAALNTSTSTDKTFKTKNR